MDLDALLKLMTDKGASDLHLKPTRPPLLRISGRLLPIESPPLRPDELTEMIQRILTPQQKARLEERMAVDIGYGVRGLARFRGNLYMQRGTLAASFRRVPYVIKSVESLDLPQVLLEFCSLPMGLVLITGPTGSGKSTSLAAMIQHITQNRPVHVITIEDPMEFLFTDDVASISQREVGTDTISFSEALRNAMRQDPDVIMVGEMRDPETVATVITAAETGHLVFSTLHTMGAAETINRVIDFFPPYQQQQVRMSLAGALKGIVSQRLVQRCDRDGRVPAMEVLVSTGRVFDKIADSTQTHELDEIIADGEYYGMETFDQSLLRLYADGVVSRRDALSTASNPHDLRLKMEHLELNREQEEAVPRPALAQSA
jgi:twitching motility protein PilT